ncbi:DEAD/DEAH box helicase [Facklamia sp. 7083-14-GEN3]|uniref:DEAD/DEAH box helicase n=1 Tax=Facklamia sp. 7083-14-GEN3 TaxID=2973478 RepID=UPI00215D0FBC|nr:DEAD/DEAH box helicase [Facklamia sp. 7083-14-GEN3]MCR8969990.1 helicase-related protein [Facklamia sp. 7083-14-GEN3]
MEWKEYFIGQLMTQKEVELIWNKYLSQSSLKLETIFNHLYSMPTIKIKQKYILCSRCNCQDQQQYYMISFNKSKIIYCCACIQMGRISSSDFLYYLPNNKPLKIRNKKSFLTWQGELSPQQHKASQEVLKQLNDSNHPHLIHAVTGAGKTEMLFPNIDEILRKGGKIAVASPRVDVCIELFPRIKSAFNSVKVLLLHGKSETKYEPCDILITTTHQLLRFFQAFDLLIVDEVDAFPYVDNDCLHFAVNRAVKEKGKLIFMTATPDKKIVKAVKKGLIYETVLPARFHGFPLVEPLFFWLGDWKSHLISEQTNSKLFSSLKDFVALDGRKLIFIANIKLAILLSEWLNKQFKSLSLSYVYSSDPLRHMKVEKMREGSYDLLISTSILERGVTFENCHVYILGAEDPLFSKSALVQMSGRVGRKASYPSGIVIFGHYGITNEMKRAVKEIREMNQLARKRGLLNAKI